MKKVINLTIALILTLQLTAQPDSRGKFVYGAKLTSDIAWIVEEVELGQKYKREQLGTVSIYMHQYEKRGEIITYWTFIPELGDVGVFEFQEGVMITEVVTTEGITVRTMPFLSNKDNIQYGGIITTKDGSTAEDNQISLWNFKNGYVMTFTHVEHIVYFDKSDSALFQLSTKMALNY